MKCSEFRGIKRIFILYDESFVGDVAIVQEFFCFWPLGNTSICYGPLVQKSARTNVHHHHQANLALKGLAFKFKV